MRAWPGDSYPCQLSPCDRQVLMEWINTTLLPEHIVVRSLEEDMFDGLILHHLFRKQRPRSRFTPPVLPKQLLWGLWIQVHPP